MEVRERMVESDVAKVEERAGEMWICDNDIGGEWEEGKQTH